MEEIKEEEIKSDTPVGDEDISEQEPNPIPAETPEEEISKEDVENALGEEPKEEV